MPTIGFSNRDELTEHRLVFQDTRKFLPTDRGILNDRLSEFADVIRSSGFGIAFAVASDDFSGICPVILDRHPARPIGYHLSVVGLRGLPKRGVIVTILLFLLINLLVIVIP